MTRTARSLILGTLVCLALVTVALAGGKKKLKKGERDPDWFSCSHISDCTVTVGLCGSPAGVAVKHMQAYDSWVQSRQNRIRCAGGIQVFHRAIVACEEGACMAGDAPAKYSARLDSGTAGECNDLSECIVSHGVCGAPLGIVWNKRKAFEKDVCKRAVAVDCAGVVRRSSRALLACEKQRCLAGPVPESSKSTSATSLQETKSTTP